MFGLTFYIPGFTFWRLAMLWKLYWGSGGIPLKLLFCIYWFSRCGGIRYYCYMLCGGEGWNCCCWMIECAGCWLVCVWYCWLNARGACGTQFGESEVYACINGGCAICICCTCPNWWFYCGRRLGIPEPKLAIGCCWLYMSCWLCCYCCSWFYKRMLSSCGLGIYCWNYCGLMLV